MTKDTPPVSRIINAPGIPVAKKSLMRKWIFTWTTATLLFLFSMYSIKFFVYVDEFHEFPKEEASVTIKSSGCDVTIEQNEYSPPGIRLYHWTFMGTSSYSRKGTDIHAEVNTERKLPIFSCAVWIVAKPDVPFANLTVITRKDEYALVNNGPSNVAEMMAVDLHDFVVKDTLHLELLSSAQTRIIGVQAEKYIGRHAGGTLSLGETQVFSDKEQNGLWRKKRYAKSSHLPKMMDITLAEATLGLVSHNFDVKINVYEDTVDNAILAAGSIKDVTDIKTVTHSKEEIQSWLLTTSKEPSGEQIEVTLEANNCAVYVKAADATFEDAPDTMEVKRGSSMDTAHAQLLPSGVEAVKKLSKYLNSTDPVKFAVYIALTAPHIPTGTLRLLSTEAYKAFPLSFYSIISMGMVQPEVIRIQTPITGFDFLFPRLGRGMLTEEENAEFMIGIFNAVTPYVNTTYFPASVWIWDPAGPDAYIYTYQQANRDRPARWSPRLITTHDHMPILIATWITIILGAIAGLLVVLGLWVGVRPRILRKLRYVSLTNSASYQLQHVMEATDWVVTICTVSYPLEGALLRWQKRPLANTFGKMIVVARQWPLEENDSPVKIDNVSAWQLPTMPNVPDQQAFLFPTHPRKKRRDAPVSLPEFEAGLWVTAMLGTGNPHLKPGHAYQFQVEAWAGDRQIEKSAWSRPVNMLPRNAFTDFPLTFWKATFGVIPEDTFQYFLDEFCVTMAPGPSLQLKLQNIRLAINNSSLLFAGAYTTYGMETSSSVDGLNANLQYVTIAVSTGSEGYELSDKDDMWEETRQIELPGLPPVNDDNPGPRSAAKLEKFSDLVREPPIGKTQAAKIPVGKSFFVLDYNTLPTVLTGKKQSKETLNMRVGSEMHLQKVQIEARVLDSAGESKGSATYENTWEELAKSILSAPDTDGGNGFTKQLSDEIILSYGISPDAVLLGDVTFENSHVEGPLHVPPPTEQGGLFGQMIPGMTMLWGEPLGLKWKIAHLQGDMKNVSVFDLAIVSEAEGFERHQKKFMSEHTTTKLAEGVEAGARKVRIFMLPEQPNAVFCMKCHLEAEAQGRLVAKSPEFVVVRPVTMQEIELGYASFCVRNNINMMKIDRDDYERTYLFDIVEREYNIISGYRKPLPIPVETNPGNPEAGVYDAKLEGGQGRAVVANGGCYTITGPSGIWLEVKQEDDKEKKKEKAAPSASSGAQVQPSDVEAGSSTEEKKLQQVAARLEFVDVPTNLFWKQKPEWKEHLLLHYSLMPNWAVDGYVTAELKRRGWYCCARVADSCDGCLRLVLRVTLYLIQLYVISLPAWLIFFLWVLHDDMSSKLNPNLDPEAEAQTTYLFSVLMSPSVFAVKSLDSWGKSVFFIVFGYALIATIGVFYGNFVHAYRDWPRIFTFLNTIISAVCVITLYAVCMYLTIVTVWMVMGAMVDPGPMMIYAIAIVGVMMITRTVWTHTKAQREQIQKNIADKLDKVTNVMMEAFVSTAQEGDVTVTDFIGIISRLVEDMRSQEKNVTERLYKQAEKIIKSTDAWEKTVTVMVRNSDEFKACVGGSDKCYSTDFVEAKFWAEAQKLANEDADMSGTRKPPLTTPPFSIPDELITPEALAKSMAMDGLDADDSLTQLNSDDEAAVQFISKALGLRPTTGTLCHQAFKSGVESVASGASIDLLSPITMACLFSQIRNDQLFRHFLWDEPAKDHFVWEMTPEKEDPPKKDDDSPKKKEKAEDDGAAKAAKAALIKDKQASVSAVYLLDFQRQEMDDIEPVLADKIVELTDWHKLGQLITKFVTRDLNIIVNHIAEAALNPVEEGSAAFKVMMSVYENAYARWSEYSADPTLMFVHSGMVDAETAKNKECQDLMKTALDQNRYADGSLDASALINAMKWATNPDRGTEDISGIVLKCYFWYGALVHMLEELGWSEDEMDEKWLKKRWYEVTEGRGFFLYVSMDELTVLITEAFSEGSLWRGAAKSFMLKAKVGGYVGCDILRDGKEKAAKNAKAVLWGDQSNLKFLNDTLVWPSWAEDLWQKFAKVAVHPKEIAKEQRPKFMDLTRMGTMLQNIVFIDDDREFKKGIQKGYLLNGLSADPEVVKYYKNPDGRIWYHFGQGYDKKKRVRGLWLELFVEVTTRVQCIPQDIDLYYDSLDWQIAGKAVERGASADEDCKVPWLNLSAFQPWVKWEYIMKKRSCTASEFHDMMKNYFNFDVPADVLKAKVFSPCPLVPDDDNGELRFLHDLAVGLRLWVGYGLWKGAIEQAVKILLPRGKIRILALKKLSEEFDKVDSAKIGIIQPGQAILLLKKLRHPGLACDELQAMLKKDLNLDIPYRELHKYFTVLDTNGDGVLGVKDFVCFVQFIMTDYYPAKILQRMNLSVRQILEMVFVSVLTFVGIIAVIKISIATFTPGEAIGHALQTGGGAIGLAMSKIQSDKRVGADEAISAVRDRIDVALTAAVATTMGLAPASVDKLHKLAKGETAAL